MFIDMEKRGRANKDLSVVIVQNLIYGKNHSIKDIEKNIGSIFGCERVFLLDS
jgi:hypothetical protein